MNVDLNECRKDLVHHFNRLTSKLNNAIEETDNGKVIRIDVETMEQCYDKMRNCIVVLAHTYMKDNPDYAPISNEIPSIEHFNDVD